MIRSVSGVPLAMLVFRPRAVGLTLQLAGDELAALQALMRAGVTSFAASVVPATAYGQARFLGLRSTSSLRPLCKPTNTFCNGTAQSSVWEQHVKGQTG